MAATDPYFCIFCDTVLVGTGSPVPAPDMLATHLTQHLMATQDNDDSTADRPLTDADQSFIHSMVDYERRLNATLDRNPRQLPDDNVQTLMIGCPVCDALLHCHDIDVNSKITGSYRSAVIKRNSMAQTFNIEYLRSQSVADQRHHLHQHLHYHPYKCLFRDMDSDGKEPAICGQTFVAFNDCEGHLRSDHLCEFPTEEVFEVVSEYFNVSEVPKLDQLIKSRLNSKPLPVLSSFDNNPTTAAIVTATTSMVGYSPPLLINYSDNQSTGSYADENQYQSVSSNGIHNETNDEYSLIGPYGHQMAYLKRKNFGHNFSPNTSTSSGYNPLKVFKRKGRPPKKSTNLAVNFTTDSNVLSNSQESDLLSNQSIDLTHNSVYSNWYTQTKRTKYPYFPQKDDEVYYIPYGHELYRSEVLRRGIYGLANKHFAMKNYRFDRILAKVSKIDFLFKERRGDHTVVRCIYVTLRPFDPKYGTIIHVKYHDMEGVVDFMVLREHYEQSLGRMWSEGDQFRSIIGDHYLFGKVVGYNGADYCQASHFQRVKVCYYATNTTTFVSPWDLETIDDNFDTNGQKYDKYSRIPVTDEDRHTFFQSLPEEWPHFDEYRELRRLVTGLKLILQMDKTTEFPILIDLTESRYRDKILYPVDMKTIIARVENRFYRRHLAIKYDIKFLEANIRKLVKSVKRDPEYRFDEVVAKRLKYHTKFVTALSLLFIDTNDCRNPYDLYPNIDEYLETHDVKCYSAKRVHLNHVKKHPNLLPAPHKRLARPQSFGDSAKVLRIFRALKNTHSSVPQTNTGHKSAVETQGRWSTESGAQHKSKRKPYRRQTTGSGDIRRSSTPKKSNTLSQPVMNERTYGGNEISFDDINGQSVQPEMYSSDVSVSENEYNLKVDVDSSDDSDSDPDFKTSNYYKNKIQIPHLKEYQQIFQNTNN